MQNATSTAIEKASWKDYLELTKPRVVLLMVITAIVGMCLASPGPINPGVFIFGNLGIALAASAAAVINHLADRHIDIRMRRTHKRPIAVGKISTKSSLIFAGTLSAIAAFLLLGYTNPLTAILTLLSLVMYSGVYTLYLKHATSQNIVIGGIAGAAPPLLGAVAVSGQITAQALLLVLIIYVWTPPHFWALAIYRYEDYKNANVPMLPNTHGIPHTKLHITLYTILLCAVTMLPFVISSSGYLYLAGALVLNARFLYWVIKLQYGREQSVLALRTFRFSISYLMSLFIVLLIDHYTLGILNHFL